jgi:hypothetical protein
MSSFQQTDRRRFLQGLGVCMALPAFESLLPRSLAAGVPEAPLRMGFIYIPNGVIMNKWTPTGTGHDYALTPTLQALDNVKSDVQILSGLSHRKAEANGDGAGDHARASATFLTGVQAHKTAGADIRLGISVDQVAAKQVGHKTMIRSLELSCDNVRKSGNCDSGYSCAYQHNLSWHSSTVPAPPEINPRLVFERMFGRSNDAESAKARQQRLQGNRSILDYVANDAKRMHQKLAYTDRQKMEDYLTSVREVEQRIEASSRFTPGTPPIEKPVGIPARFEDYVRLMFDLNVIAFQTDSTRISTFLLAREGSDRSFPDIGVRDAHHGLSHHQNDEDKIAMLEKIDAFYIRQCAYFLENLKQTTDGNGSLLDQSMIVIGSAISDGNKHSHHDLPVILAGGGNGTFDTGRHVQLKDEPMTNLHMAMLERMNVKAERHGDSTGVLKNI